MIIFHSIRSAIMWLIGVVYLKIFLITLIILTYIMKRDQYDPILQAMDRFLFKLLFIKVKTEGVEKVDKNQVYVVMGNHVSMFDIPLLFGFIPVRFNGIEAAEHFKAPIYGHALKRYGNIPINRKNARESFKTILQGADMVKKGTSIVILPEGTRSLKPQMGEFKKFPFILAKKAEAPILPFGFSGLWKINNKTSWLIKPGKVTMKFGEPIPARVVKEKSIEELMELTRKKIEELITEP